MATPDQFVTTSGLPTTQTASVNDYVAIVTPAGSRKVRLSDLVAGGMTEGLAAGAAWFDDTAAGLAATVEGEYFTTPSSNPDAALIVWRHDSGDVAGFVTETPNSDQAVNLVKPLRLKGMYQQPTFADGVPPTLRNGVPQLEPITDPYLANLGAVNGVYMNSAGAPYVVVPADPDWVGKHIIMSCYVYTGDGIAPSATGSVFLDAENSIITTGLESWTYQEEVATNVWLCLSWGTVPAGVDSLAIGKNLGQPSPDRLITGINYTISVSPITKNSFFYDDFSPITASNDPTAAARVVVDNFVSPVFPNMLQYGDFIGGEPEFRTPTKANITTLTQPELTNRGFERGIRWGTSNNFARHYLSEDMQGKRVIGALYIYSENPDNIPESGHVVFQEDGAANLNSLAASERGNVILSNNLVLCWQVGVVDQADTERLLVGSSVAPVDGTRYSSGFWLAELGDSDPADFLRNALLADKTRRAIEQDRPAIEARARVVLSGDGSVESFIETWKDGHAIRRGFVPFPDTDQLASSVFNFTSDWIDGLQVRSMNDDVAPYRAEGTTIGANHGYRRTVITAASHGKTQADVGSVWTDGVLEHVIVGLPDTDSLIFTSRVGNDYTPTGTLTHVSGGTNTGDITGTAASDGQLYPPFKNRVIRCVVDGIEVTDREATVTYHDKVQFVESYDVMSKQAIADWFVANPGTSEIIPAAPAAFTVSITYEFDVEGNCTVYTDFLALESTPLQDIMFLQAARMTTGVDGDVNYYIPKTLPVTHQGESYDYANIDSTDVSAWTARLNFTPARCEPNGILADRVVQLTDRYGFVVGFLPVQTADVAERRAQATVKGIQISNSSAKVYMSAVDKGNVTLAPGEYFSVIGYRNLLVRDPARTCVYPVRTQGADYLYVDWHGSRVDRVPVPVDYAGRTFEVVEKSENVTIMSASLTNSIVVDVTSSTSYGYLILKVI